jgi:hypothetical protein
MVRKCGYAGFRCNRARRDINDAAEVHETSSAGLRNIEEGKVFWADLNSDSDYDAEDFMPKMRANIGNQNGDHTPSPVIDSKQAAPEWVQRGSAMFDFEERAG